MNVPSSKKPVCVKVESRLFNSPRGIEGRGKSKEEKGSTETMQRAVTQPSTTKNSGIKRNCRYGYSHTSPNINEDFLDPN